MDTSDRHRAPGRRTHGLAAIMVVASGLTACDSASTSWQTPLTPVGPSVSVAPPTSASPTTSLSAADACVATTMAKMTVAQMAGQVMLVGTPLTASQTAIDKVIREYAVGGVFLNGRSTSSASKLHSMIASMQSTAAAAKDLRLFVSLDQEGGEVQALKGTDFPPIPTALAQGNLSTSALSAQTKAWAKRLWSIGVTLDLAPVSDTVPASLGTKNPPIGAFHRQYGSDPTKVAADITTVVKAVESTGVTTTLKHFPGLGRVLANTDFSNKAIDKVTTAHDTYLLPFIAGIKAGTGAVMISSASYPSLDSHSIATWSQPIVTGLLRNQLGFTGMIVSDSLAGAAAISAVPVGQRGVRFIEAGGDLVLTTAASKAPAMVKGMIAEAHDSAAFTAKLKAAATYVVRNKYSSGLLTCSPPRP
jgi:beta-N-acetylhexosaminidase